MSDVQAYLCRVPTASHRRQQNATTTAQIRAMLIIILAMLTMMVMMIGKSSTAGDSVTGTGARTDDTREDL